jgi:hypothetical protein
VTGEVVGVEGHPDHGRGARRAELRLLAVQVGRAPRGQHERAAAERREPDGDGGADLAATPEDEDRTCVDAHGVIVQDGVAASDIPVCLLRSARTRVYGACVRIRW